MNPIDRPGVEVDLAKGPIFRLATDAGAGSMTTIILLCLSDTFMTYAWYGHLKFAFAFDKPAVVAN